MEHDPVGLIPALHRCWDVPGQVRQQDQGLWPSSGKQFHGRVAFYVWILWLESHMFAVAGSQKTVQMQWGHSCLLFSFRVISLYWNYLFNLGLFLCIWGKETLFQFPLLWRKYQIFLFTRTKVLKSGCWTTLRYPRRKLLLHPII